MRISFSDALCEEAVESEIAEQSRKGDFRIAQSIRKEMDRVYEDVSSRKRASAFSALYQKYFQLLGFPDRLERIFAEMDGIERLPGECLVVRVVNESEEGAQLSEDGSRVGIRLRTDTLRNFERCAYLLRHELVHIFDILDPEFECDPNQLLSEVSPSEDALFRDRYRTLWDLSVDGRLERKGWLPESVRERRFSEFRALYPNIGDDAAEKVIGALWSDPRVRDTAFRRMVQGAASLCAAFGVSDDSPFAADSLRRLSPGSLCPLCQFPTFDWAESSDALSGMVKAEYPGWNSTQGICTQCANRYLFALEIATDAENEQIAIKK
ncbi:MAG: hypothetical protein O2807_00685 [bacterium]|nr:hypothetical protein [bacterium]